MFVTALLESAIQTYIIVGLLTVLVLPRTRSSIVAALADRGWPRKTGVVYVAYCASVLLVTAIAWPWLLRATYLQTDYRQAAIR